MCISKYPKRLGRPKPTSPGSVIADHVGITIIRAWIEDGSSEPLRAHIRITNDVSAGFERTLTLSQPEAVCSTVQEWLADMLRGAEQPD